MWRGILLFCTKEAFLPLALDHSKASTFKTDSVNGVFGGVGWVRRAGCAGRMRKKKIQVGANVPAEHIISAPDMATIYDIPLRLEEENLGEKLLAKLQLEPRRKPDWSHWHQLLRRSLPK